PPLARTDGALHLPLERAQHPRVPSPKRPPLTAYPRTGRAVGLAISRESGQPLRGDVDGGGRLRLLALPAFVWVEIESSTVKVDGGLEVLRVAEAAGRLLDPLDHRVDRLETRIGEAVLQVGQQIGQVALDQLGDHDHRPQAAVGGAPEPAPEEAARRAKVGVLPEGPEPFLEGPGAGHLEIALL